MDYEIYTFKMSNKTDKAILLDSGESTQKMYVVDQKNVKSRSYRNEVVDAELLILPNATNQFEIKYNSAYIGKRETSLIVFSDVILDYNLYKNTSIKNDYTNRTLVEIEL